jgi:hypothetical protein
MKENCNRLIVFHSINLKLGCPGLFIPELENDHALLVPHRENLECNCNTNLYTKRYTYEHNTDV